MSQVQGVHTFQSRSTRAADAETLFEDVTEGDYHRDRRLRDALGHPEVIASRFREAMVRSLAPPEWADRRFGLVRDDAAPADPTWTFARVGATHTRIERYWRPSGAAVESVLSIGGAYKGRSNEAFYNDLVVRGLDGGVSILLYRESDFLPLAHHTTTMDENTFVVIGGQSEAKHMEFWRTPIFWFDGAFAVTVIEPKGDEPGWIWGHRSVLVAEDRIRVWGGRVLKEDGRTEPFSEVWDLDTLGWTWTRVS